MTGSTLCCTPQERGLVCALPADGPSCAPWRWPLCDSHQLREFMLPCRCADKLPLLTAPVPCGIRSVVSTPSHAMPALHIAASLGRPVADEQIRFKYKVRPLQHRCVACEPALGHLPLPGFRFQLKTRKGAAKRFKVTPSGHFKHSHAFRGHLMLTKERKRVNALGETSYVHNTNVREALAHSARRPLDATSSLSTAKGRCTYAGCLSDAAVTCLTEAWCEGVAVLGGEAAGSCQPSVLKDKPLLGWPQFTKCSCCGWVFEGQVVYRSGVPGTGAPWRTCLCIHGPCAIHNPITTAPVQRRIFHQTPSSCSVGSLHYRRRHS